MEDFESFVKRKIVRKVFLDKERAKKLIKDGESLLDVGSGNGMTYEMLIKNNRQIYFELKFRACSFYKFERLSHFFPLLKF